MDWARAGRGEVVGVVPIEAFDLLFGNEALDVDRLGARQLDRFDLLVGQQDVVVLGDSVALDQRRAFHRPGIGVRCDVTPVSHPAIKRVL